MADPGSLDITAGLARFKSSSATGSGNLAPSCSAPSSAVERAKIRNKTAQSRFRARQKARAETLEAMLLLTTIELRQMQSKQEPLEKRIRMLEMLVNANSTTSNPAPPASSGQGAYDVCSVHGFETEPDPMLRLMSDNPSMQTTLNSGHLQLTCNELRHMDLTELARLYSTYVHQLGIYLVEASETHNQEVCNRLDQLAVETGSLLICMALSNPKAFKAMQSTRLDKEHFEEVLQPDSFYTGMLALLYIFDRRYIALQIATDLSVNQTDDILWIRRLFYRKLGQLARHRKALLSRMTQSQVDTCHASEKLSGLTDWGECLHQNGLDEYRTWLQFALCLMRGVYTPKQTAVSWVYAYPTMYKGNKLVDALAALNSEPTTQQFMDDVSLSDTENAVNWEHVVAYTHTVTPENVHHHISFTSYFAVHARYSKQR
ncbi:hypothetical protein ABBQ32_002214 [Trebouxia sp. C0010 RCD-2024]